MSKERVGLIGAGLMGHGMGKNIVLKGFPPDGAGAPQSRTH